MIVLILGNIMMQREVGESVVLLTILSFNHMIVFMRDCFHWIMEPNNYQQLLDC